jgi:prophage regulatory protein
MQILRLKEVIKRTGLSRSTIYHLISEGQFPSPTRLTKRCIGWAEDVIHDWIVKRLEAAAR